MGRLDLLIWLLVLLFFCGSALISGGNLLFSFGGAAAIIAEMVLIGITVEIIIECLKNAKGIGTITGFITNGPEAICLIAGLAAGDIIFAASTPLGSNFMNPVLLLAAALLCGSVLQTFGNNPKYTIPTLGGTAGLAASFFFLSSQYYWYWLLAAITFSSIVFFLRPKEEQEASNNEEQQINPRIWFIPAILVLSVAGYFLDGVVSFTADSSHAPKGVIGFLVLATLTSWPEFKSCLSLLRKEKHLAAILNITVSNITNIWLAATGIIFYLLLK